ncbi:Uncharacterised protein [Moraxella lacunata]|uniref:Chemotaxis protein n=1 Tax=Moraxella lacunata TaxID=477 RepID=A0A378TVM7_MORLA|nr:hypothetical protein [Moraxella lacunata]STZ64324.1 Uncharacterised protein [Moraxella lacunata]
MPLPIIVAGVAGVVVSAATTKKTYDAYQDSKKSRNITRMAQAEYEKTKLSLENAQKLAEQKLADLDKLYFKIGQDFHEFREVSEALIDKLNQGSQKHIEIKHPKKIEMEKIENISMNSAAYLGGVMIFGLWGTWIFSNHAKDNLQKAKSIQSNVAQFTKNANVTRTYLKDLSNYLEVIIININDLHEKFKDYLDILKQTSSLVKTNQVKIIEHKTELHRKIENGYALAAILTDVMTTPIFKIETSNGKPVYNEDGTPMFQQEAGGHALNDKQMQEVMDQAALDSKAYTS